jgi:hypothetical protein
MVLEAVHFIFEIGKNTHNQGGEHSQEKFSENSIGRLKIL